MNNKALIAIINQIIDWSLTTMNLKLLSSTPTLSVILMDKAKEPLIRVFQQIGLCDEECNDHRSIPPKESSENVVCISQTD